MQNPNQDHLFKILEKQQQQKQYIDRILKFIFPVMSFLLSVICANMNWQSTLGTFVMMTIALYSVGIKRMNLWVWMTLVIGYCLVDNYFSYGGFNVAFLRLQLITMVAFLAIVGLGRPYLDQFWLKQNHKTLK